MLEADDCIYIDKLYKNDMEMYEAIKAKTHKVIKEN